MKKILFITILDIYDEYGNGGCQAARKNYSLIKNTESFDVYVYRIYAKNYKSIGSADVDTKVNNLFMELLASFFGYKRIMPWEKTRIRRFIKDNNIDTVFVDESILGNIVNGLDTVKTITFFHNCEFEYAMNKVRNEGIQYILPAYSSWRNEKNAMKSDYIICLNSRDSDILYKRYKRETDYIIPISFEDKFEIKCVENKKYNRSLLFFGSFFGPNIDGIEWFLENVYLRLHNISLVVAGKGFEKKKEEYEKYNGVTVIGTVEDTSQVFYEFPAVVLPIRYGSGMKVKTCESMMFGRHIFASDEALEGYDVKGIDGIEKCNSANEYVEAISQYFDNNQFIPYEPDVRQLFISKYENSVIQKGFNDFIQKVMD